MKRMRTSAPDTVAEYPPVEETGELIANIKRCHRQIDRTSGLLNDHGVNIGKDVPAVTPYPCPNRPPTGW